MEEGFVDHSSFFNSTNTLPNTNIPDKNYSEESSLQSVNSERTERLSNNNRYDGEAYTDKFFNPSHPKDIFYSNKNTMGGGEENYQSLAGEKVGNDYFRHNNMVPYFGSKIRSRTFDERNSEIILDNYLGAGSQYIDKKEQAPLFMPDENYNWAYGAPNQNDFYQSRVNPSLKISNTKPFQEETVGPGLGLGYTTEGVGGYNSGMLNREAWIDKNIDELRVDNHRKPEGVGLFGHEGPAISRVTSQGTIGQVEKNRPDTTFESGSERWLTTTGVVKNQPMRAIPVERRVNRPETSANSANYSGIATANTPGTYVDGEYMPSTNIQLGSVPLSAASSVGMGGGTEADYGAKSQFAYMNNRAANQQPDYFGAVGGAIGAVVSPLLDILRPSRKQNVVGTLRPYQNATTKVPLSYIFNPADRPGTTIRETTENSKFNLNVNSNQYNSGAYMVTEQQPIVNERMNQSDFYYAGNASAGERGREARTYDAEYNQRNNNIKSSTIDGRLVPGNMALLNNQTNIRAGDRNPYLMSKNAPVPVISYQTPSLETMGQLNGRTELYSGTGYDRNTSDVMSALKGNPYALSVTGGI